MQTGETQQMERLTLTWDVFKYTINQLESIPGAD